MKKSLVKNRSDITIERQCELLGISVSTYYYRPAEKPAAQLEREDALRAAIDRWHTKMPYLGSRRLVTKLAKDGIKTNRKEVKKFMDEMGIYAIYPKPNLSMRNKKHKIYPYLLRNKVIFLPNQVWALDIWKRARTREPKWIHPIIEKGAKEWLPFCERLLKGPNIQMEPFRVPGGGKKLHFIFQHLTINH